MENYSTSNVEELIAQGKIGRHETFTPRYGWLKKGFDAVLEDPYIFNAPNAIEKLGVGKNMVRSIRFWCIAFKLINNDLQPTQLGNSLMNDKNGWDPYLEDDASLWLLHWQLFLPTFEAISWPLAFNHCNLWSFDILDLSKIIINSAQSYPNLAKMSAKTYQRDASCIIRMYVDKEDKDSEIECPFTQLGLIYNSADKNQVGFNTDFKPSLPALLFAAACFSYAEQYLPPGQKNITLQRVVFGFNSPGIAFKISETDAGNLLDEASKSLNGFSLVSRLGDTQLFFEESPKQLYLNALNKYYLER